MASTQTGADVGPSQFHFLDIGKRHAQSSYDLKVRALHYETEIKTEEYTTALRDWEAVFVAVLSRSGVGGDSAVAVAAGSTAAAAGGRISRSSGGSSSSSSGPK